MPKGRGTLSFTADTDNLPAMVYIRAAASQHDTIDMGEKYGQTDALAHAHDGLILPANNDPAENMELDKGPVHVSFTTQSLFIGTHRELDDRTGFTDNIGVGGSGDGFPKGTAIDEIEVTLMQADSRGRLRAFEYDHDLDPETPDEAAVGTFDGSGQIQFEHVPANAEVTAVARAGSGMTIIPDDRDYKEIDAFGSAGSAHPEGGVFLGGFGPGAGGGGARPDVWLCPLQRQTSDDPNEVCSTYAYKWKTGTISGEITGLRKDDEVTVTLTPVNSNPVYADDLAQDEEVTAGANGVATYSFDGIPDGRYRVTLEANEGSWEEAETEVLAVMHDEENDDEDYTGETVSGDATKLPATNLRGVIRGVIGNNSNGRAGFTGSESRAGVVVNLHEANAAISSGVNEGRRTHKSAIVATAETDDDGAFMFENLQVDKYYYLMPQGTDLYTAVRVGDASMPGQKTTDVVTHALTRAIVPDDDYEPNDAISWNARKSTLSGADANDFALLYRNGEVEGEVWDPSVRELHIEALVELRLCKTTFPVDDPETDVDESVGTSDSPVVPSRCASYADDDGDASVDDDGDWIADGLREGWYEVVVDLPAGYDHVNMSGTAANDDDPGTDVDENTYFTQQMVELEGGRADAGTKRFWIKDRNAGSDAALNSVAIDSNPPCALGAGTDRCVDNKRDDNSISVVVSASRAPLCA